MKKYKSIKIQLFILKNRGLAINDEDYAKKLLTTYGYHEVINGYQNVFRDKTQSTERFIDGASFEDIASLYIADKNLRSYLRNSLEEIELSFKTVLIDVVSNAFGVEESKYLNKLNFKKADRFSRKLNKVVSDRDWLFSQLNKKLSSHDKIISHHRSKGNVPPWALIKELDFGTLKTFYVLLDDTNLKTEIVSKFLERSNEFVSNIDIPTQKKFLVDLLNLSAKFRNRASHGMRIYDYEPKERGVGFKILNDSNMKDSGVYGLAMAFSLLENHASFDILMDAFGDFYIGTMKIDDKFKESISQITNIPINLK